MLEDTAVTEQWLPVVGFENYYEVSDLGRVRSLDRVVRRGNGLWHHHGVILKAIWQGSRPARRRLIVNLSVNNVMYSRLVHLLVLEAFVSIRPVGSQGCHNSGDPSDNRVSNLRWDTPSANARDAIQHGTHTSASKSECINGHLLRAPNLRPYKTRVCLACGRARANQKYARKRGYPFDFLVAADRHYRQIMEGA
jgi:hypothetical protein